MKKKLSCCL